MQEKKVNIKDLIAMANKLAGCKMDRKYFPVMFHSRPVKECLQNIYILRRSNKLSVEDNLEIKRIFHGYFKFFAQQFNKLYLILSCFFLMLIVFLTVASFCWSIYFIPFIILFIPTLIFSACCINIQTYPVKVTHVHENFRRELRTLEYNLNKLNNSLVDKYGINTDNDFTNNMDISFNSNEVNEPGTSQNEKKAVSYASKLSVFFESYESRSRTSSENSVSCRIE